MNKIIAKINKSYLFQKKQICLINLRYPCQFYRFSNIKEKAVKYILITNKKLVNYQKKKILVLDLKKFFRIPVNFNIFISTNPDVNNEKFILRIIMKKPFYKKAFFFCDQKMTNKIMTGYKNKNFLYIKILTKVSILNENLNYISNINTNKLFKFVTRNILPSVNFFKWDRILKLFFSQKKIKIGKFTTNKNFLRYLFEIMINNSKSFNSIVALKDFFQRIFEESGVLATNMDFISIKDFYYFFNNI
jgi:hypothetical protein